MGPLPFDGRLVCYNSRIGAGKFVCSISANAKKLCRERTMYSKQSDLVRKRSVFNLKAGRPLEAKTRGYKLKQHERQQAAMRGKPLVHIEFQY